MVPYFSIIIPLYNKEKYVAYTLTSVINQTFKDFEVIIVNDGSTDDSLKIVSKFNDKRITIFSKDNNGVSSARNYGIEKAQATYIAFLDADDYWHDTFLETIYSLISTYNNQSVFATALKVIAGKTSYFSSYKIIPFNNEHGIVDFFEASKKQSVLHGSSSVFNKDVFNKVGCFNTSLQTSEDTDLWIRIGLVYPVVFTKKPLAMHRALKNGLTGRNRTFFNSIDFKTYENKSNESHFKFFINKNKFASAIKHKLAGDFNSSNKLKASINYKLLTLKQKLMLSLPIFILKPIVNLYNRLLLKKGYF